MLELLFVFGLVLEGVWLVRNLGDWKNVMLFFFVSDMLSFRLLEIVLDLQIVLVFLVLLEDIKFYVIVMLRFYFFFKLIIILGEE